MRDPVPTKSPHITMTFPFLFGGTFIEGAECMAESAQIGAFPFLFGGTFIEGRSSGLGFSASRYYFPSFSEGLSLRVILGRIMAFFAVISLPFRRDFH